MPRLLKPHPVVWLHRTMRVWWPFFVSLGAICLIATMTFVTYTVVAERRYFEQEQARDRRQDEQLARLLERQEAESGESEAQIAAALNNAEQLLIDHFARHDLNVATKLNDLLAQIQALLERPAGTPPSPVIARIPVDPVAPHQPTAQPAPTASPRPAATTTTTTTPDQRRCAVDPDHPRC